MTIFRSVFCAMVASFVAFPVCVYAQTSTTDWSVAALDEILANIQPGQKTARIDDMEILVSNLRAWRDQLAGAPRPKIALAGAATPLWTGGNVYYSFSNNVAAAKQKAFLDGAAEWALFANLHFIARSTQANYVLVYENDSNLGDSGGAASVGMQGGEQILWIGPEGWNHYVICHELGHTLGMCHEQQRSDRDSYITIITNNVAPDGWAGLVKLTGTLNLGPYDFLSVMHYARWAGSIDPIHLNTMVPLPQYSQYLNLLNGASDPVLSQGDRAGMAALYGAGPGVSPIVTNTADSGPGSLRAALYYAYDNPGTTIAFNIPTNDPGYSNGVFTIRATDVLPGLYNSTVVDGTAGATSSIFGKPAIQITGAFAQPPRAQGGAVHVRGTNSIVRGLIVNGFTNSFQFTPALSIDGANAMGNVVSGCYLGLDSSGTVALPSQGPGVTISGGASSNLVGGYGPAARNVISGNASSGVWLKDTNTIENIVAGNFIGLGPTGSVAVANGFFGVQIDSGAAFNTVTGNVISGNASGGVLIRNPGSSSNVVQGNLVGLDAGGTYAVTNGGPGIDIYNCSQSNLVGGYIASARNVVSGSGNQGVAIADANSTGNVVAGNYIGLNAAGTAAVPNAYEGVAIWGGAQSNLIGGNVVSGNGNKGVAISGTGTSGNTVVGNYIGLNNAGTAAIPNGDAGIGIWGGAQSNLIGGYAVSARNVISGNGSKGIAISDPGTKGNVVAGNYVGLDVSGTIALPNAYQGVAVWGGAQSNLIGGYTLLARNVVSGNGSSGVELADTNTIGNIVAGNYVGLNAAGSTLLPNAGAGVEVHNGASQNVVGGSSIGAGNVISGNNWAGTAIHDPGTANNFVQGNCVGLNASYTMSMPNAAAGVLVYNGAQSNLIGGTTFGAPNLIASNGADGIQFWDVSSNNTARANSIFGNNGVGIGLYNGGNNSASAPSLTSAVLTTSTTISGSLTNLANTTFKIDFYSSPASPAQGMTYLGATNVTTSAGGSVSFTAKLADHVPAGRIITATATDPAGNTSAMSGGGTVTVTSSVNDGIPDAWRAQYFGGNERTTNSQSCATCDPDHDGMNNLQEFLAGTNPTNAASVLRLNALSSNPSNNVASFFSASGTIYRVQYRDDLLNGFWSIAADQVVGTGTNIFIADPSVFSMPRRFYRLQVLW